MPIISSGALPEIPESPIPRAAFLLYTCEGRLFATVHPLRATRSGQASLGAGRPLTHRDLHGWLAELADQAPVSDTAWLSDSLLARGQDFSVWWRRAQIAPIWFLLQGERFGFRVPWPPLVFVARGRDLWCVALARNTRPQPNTKLCHAPLMNINAHGAVCLGNAEPPPEGAIAALPAWEATVCETHFSHVSHDHTLTLAGHARVGTEAHFAFWQRLDGAAHFPTEALAPLPWTLKRWVEDLLQ